MLVAVDVRDFASRNNRISHRLRIRRQKKNLGQPADGMGYPNGV
jgi:hypothetical protein